MSDISIKINILKQFLLIYGELCGVLGPQSKSIPLHHAAANGRSEAVQLLLTAKADAGAANQVSDLPSVM